MKNQSKKLSLKIKELIKDYVLKAKKQVVDQIDLEKNILIYKDIFSTGRDLSTKNVDDEEFVRAFILTELVNEYGYKPSNITLESCYTMGRNPNNKQVYLDIRVQDSDENAFLLFECKTPVEFDEEEENAIKSQLFDISGGELARGHSVKYLVYYTIDELDGKITDKCYIIDREKYVSYDKWKGERNYTDTIPLNYGKAIKTPYVKGSKKDLCKSFTKETLDKLQTNLHNVLWGGGGTDDNEVFSSLTNLILAKIQDEDTKDDGDTYEFQSLAFEKDDGNKFESNQELFIKINNLYRKALKEKLYITDKEELDKSFVIDPKSFSLEKLKYTVQSLEKFSFVDGKNSLSGKDILGDFFEGIIRTGFKQSKGQFFTHTNIVRFMLWGLQADKLAIDRINKDREIPYMIDPSAGSGTFMIEYMKFITNNIKYRFKNKLVSSRAVQDKVTSDWFYPDNRENKWAREFIYGSELNFNLGTATKVNMILHGDGSTNIFVGANKGDGLLPFKEYIKFTAPNALNNEISDEVYPKYVNEEFDLILTNPPFSTSLDKETERKVATYFVFGEKKCSENLFIERYYQLLKPNGRLAVVLPESVFDTIENDYIRLFLYKFFKIKAIVSLPQLAFEPYTSTKTSVLFAQKKTKEEIKEWDTIWNKYSNEWSRLSTRVSNIIANKTKAESIKNLSDDDKKDLVIRLLDSHFNQEDSDKKLDIILKKYKEELSALTKFDKKLTNVFGFTNSWWTFSKTARELDNDIQMIEVSNIGYKRVTNGIKKKPNELYRTKEQDPDFILVDDGVKETALDYLRDIKWN